MQAVVQHPAEGEDHCSAQGSQRDEDLAACFLDGDGGVAGFEAVVWRELRGETLVVPVEHAAGGDGGDHGACADGDVAETDFEDVEAVQRAVDARDGGEYGHVPAHDHAGDEEHDHRVAVEDEDEWFQRVGEGEFMVWFLYRVAAGWSVAVAG